MSDMASDASVEAQKSSGGTAHYRKRDFWIKENAKHVPAHYRLRKVARIANRLARGEECDLLDVGCGPATLMTVLQPNISYYGIDIAIRNPASNLIEADLIETPIRFGDRRFRIVVAQGVFEYIGDVQSRKFAEIASILTDDGKFVVSYTNFGHRKKHVFDAFNNVMSIEDFRQELQRYFDIDQSFPTSHNWYGGQPTRRLVKAINMRVNTNVPFVSRRLAVEYFFICSPRR